MRRPAGLMGMSSGMGGPGGHKQGPGGLGWLYTMSVLCVLSGQTSGLARETVSASQPPDNFLSQSSRHSASAVGGTAVLLCVCVLDLLDL